MAILTLVKNIGGTLETYFVGGPPAACSVTLYTDQGAAKVSGDTCTIDSVSTTVSAVSAKATTLTLASAAGVVVGRRYLLGTYDSVEPPEMVTVKSLASSTATIWGPLAYAHASGAALRGCRVTYDVSAAACDAFWYGGHADFVPSTGDPQAEDVDCCAHKIPEHLCDETDIREVFPKFGKMISAELDLPRSLRVARDEFLVDFGGKFRVMAALGSSAFRRACALKWWLLRRWDMGADHADTMTKLDEEYQGRISHLRAQIPADKDGDESTIGPDDTLFTTIQLSRM